MKLAKYKCQRCGYQWQDKPGPVTCPKCNWDYIDWINVSEFMEV